MKSKFLIPILAAVAAALMPLAASSQIAPDRPPRTEPTEKSTKYEIFAGVGYTSLNNVYQSRNGLLGANVTVTRDWGKYFGVTADGGWYKYTYDASNDGNPSVDMLLFGPVVHGHIMGKVSGYAHLLLGGEHISGTSSTAGLAFATPKISVAGGYGVGLDYKLISKFSLRIGGDDIISSFSANTNAGVCTPTGACSTHETRSARAAFGLVYEF